MAIAFFAMLLALTVLGGQNATKDVLNSNITASNQYEFFQAKNMRQTAIALAADQIELAWLNDPAISAETKAVLAKKVQDYGPTVAR